MCSTRIIAVSAGIALAILAGGLAPASAQQGPAGTRHAQVKVARVHVHSSAAHASAEAGMPASRHVARAGSNTPQVFLLKGLADVFSSGLDKLAVKLEQRGIVGRVASHASSDSLAAEAIARYRAGQHGPIVIAGHSLGADAAVSMSQRLNDAKVPVALVITFGPVGYPRVMGNVARAVNFYQANSAWHGQIVRGPGFHGLLKNIDLENAIDINHFNIEKADRIQAAAITQITAALGRGRRTPKTSAPVTAGETHAPVATKSENVMPAAATQRSASGEPAPAKQN